MPELVRPHARFKTSFLAALREYHAEGLPNYESMSEDWAEEHFEEYIAQMEREAKGEDLPPGWVAHTVFWLAEGDEYLGRLDIRHELNQFLRTIGGHIGYDIRPSQRGKGYGHLILELGLEKAKELGFENVLITCDITNLPSNKIIQAHGGVLEDTYTPATDQSPKNRYWIALRK